MNRIGLTIMTTISLLFLFQSNLLGLSIDASINTGIFEYRGPTERNGYALGINTNLFFFSDLALSIGENISYLESGIYKGQKYANEATLVNSTLGLMFIVDNMTLNPFIKISSEFYKGNFLGNSNYDYGYSISAGIRYEKFNSFLTIEMAYKQLYKTTTEWPSIILFTIGAGSGSNRNKNKEIEL